MAAAEGNFHVAEARVKLRGRVQQELWGVKRTVGELGRKLEEAAGKLRMDMGEALCGLEEAGAVGGPAGTSSGKAG